MLLQLPTEEELSRQRSFQVLKNYLSAGVSCVESEFGGSRAADAILAYQRRLRGFRRVQRRALADPAAVQQALVLGWTSRLQLSLADYAGSDELLPYANAWAPVHAYYAVYGSVRALLLSRGLAISDHSAALNAISTEVCKGSGVVPAPWRIGCIGCPHVDDPVQFIGLPDGVAHEKGVQLLGNSDSSLAWPRLLKALETTREETLCRRYKQWCKQNGRKNTYAREKVAIAAKVPPTTLFDIFWRLRVRANYRDAASFVMVTIGTDWHREFLESLTTLAELSSLLVENLLVQQVGLDPYAAIAKDFSKWTPGNGPADFLPQRLELLSDRST
ncbi:MAG: hypothetical protein ACYCX5_12760 [Coriobacteriia bacterium]